MGIATSCAPDERVREVTERGNAGQLLRRGSKETALAANSCFIDFSLRVESLPGQGTFLRIELPELITPQKGQEPALAEATGWQQTSHGRTHDLWHQRSTKRVSPQV